LKSGEGTIEGNITIYLRVVAPSNYHCFSLPPLSNIEKWTATKPFGGTGEADLSLLIDVIVVRRDRE
jgi:hypothetical protein